MIFPPCSQRSLCDPYSSAGQDGRLGAVLVTARLGALSDLVVHGFPWRPSSSAGQRWDVFGQNLQVGAHNLATPYALLGDQAGPLKMVCFLNRSASGSLGELSHSFLPPIGDVRCRAELRRPRRRTAVESVVQQSFYTTIRLYIRASSSRARGSAPNVSNASSSTSGVVEEESSPESGRPCRAHDSISARLLCTRPESRLCSSPCFL